ncbi:MAG: hypothetical protein ABI548_18585 [Polyangiaceae bacterium]
MSENRSRLWVVLTLAVTSTAVGCVDGSLQAGQNAPATNMTSVAGGGILAGSAGGNGVSGAGNVADGSCKDVLTDPAHCGSCSTACTAGQACVQGVCMAAAASCIAPQTLCNGACVDLTAPANCGKCGNACATGQSCTAGVCACPAGQTACNGICLDTQSSNDNCGACNQACATGAVCTAGACGCPTGQTTCSGVCADTSQSDANCGACGQACAMGASCSAGKCVTGAGADGCSGPALGVTLQSVAVYQTVKIAVMNAGAEVGTDKRATDVITGRQTLFRLSVTVDGGFAARQLSGRVTVNNGASVAQYFAKLMVSKSSVDTDSTTTFQVYVPPEQITADTRYTAELVECGTGSGTAGQARFPATADIPLGARHTGGVKVKIIPLLSNGKLPDTSDAALEIYKQQLIAMYPIDSVDFSIGTQLSIAYPVDWSGALDQVRAKRKTEAPPADVYYFGLLKPVDTFTTFCGNGCTTGIGYVADANSGMYRAAMGVGFSDRFSAQTMAHELGHNHGRNHAPCVPSGGTISGVDPMYPFPDGSTGVIGYDSRTKVLLSAKGTDLMGYCSNVWLSEYTYGGITDRVAIVNGNQAQKFNPAALQKWRVLIVSSTGAHWGLPITEPSLPEGKAETATILDADGNEIEDITVYRTEMSDGFGAVILVPEAESGWGGVRVTGSAVVGF